MKKKHLAFILAADLGLLLLLELLLHAFGLFAPRPIFTERTVEGRTVVRYEIASTHPEFAAQKPADTVRVFCYGGSTTFGFPFHEKTSFPAQLQVLLNRAAPQKKWEIINLGMMGLDSEEVRDIFFASLPYRPDLVVFYTGQNEYFRSSLLSELDYPRLLAVRRFLSRHSRIYNAAVQLGPALAALPLMGWQKRPDFLADLNLRFDLGPHEEKPISPKMLALRQRLYRLHLDQILDVAAAADIPVILSTLVVNLRDWPPEPLPYPAGLAPDQISELERLLLDGESRLDRGDPPGALPLLAQAVTLAPGYARAEFLRGRATEAAGDLAAARDGYRNARAHDTSQQHRCPPEMNVILRESAEKRRLPLLDVEALFQRSTVYAAPGFDLIIDHVHPNLRGQALIAEALLAEVRGLPEFAPGPWTELPPWTEEQTREQFALTSDYLADVGLRLGLYYGLQKNLPSRNAFTLQTLAEVQSLRPNDPLPGLFRFLVLLSQGDNSAALDQLSQLRQQMPDKIGPAIFRYLAYSASQRGNTLALDLPETPFRPPLRGMLQSRPDSERPKEANGDELGRYDRFFEWSPETAAYVDVTESVHTALAKRRQTIAELGHAIRPIYLAGEARLFSLEPGPGLKRHGEGGNDFWLEDRGAWLTAALSVEAEMVKTISLDYRLQLDDSQAAGQIILYWATREEPDFAETRKLLLPLTADGRFHAAQFSTGLDPRWARSGTVTHLRLDPGPGKGDFSLRKLVLNPYTDSVE